LGGLRAEVNNGGFDQYFFNSAGDLVADAVEAAEAVGVTELASLIRRGLDLLNVQDPADRAARQDALSNLDPEEFADIDDDYYALEASADLDSSCVHSCNKPGPSRDRSRETAIRFCRSARMHHVVTASCSSRPQQVAVGSVAETGAADDRLMAAATESVNLIGAPWAFIY